MNRIRGGYIRLRQKMGSILAQGKNVFRRRPGYIAEKHLQFLDGIASAIWRGKDPLPYLVGEFPELNDPQAESIIRWWRDNREPPGRDKTGG